MGHYTPQYADQREQLGVGVAGSGKYEMAEGMEVRVKLA